MAVDTVIRLNIGGDEPHPDWQIVNIQPGPHVDHQWDACNLDLPDDSVDEIYASHVLEHITYQANAPLQEWYRVLKPGGRLRVSVPNLPLLCHLYLRTRGRDRHSIMRMIYGGQLDEHDYHKAGYDEDRLTLKLRAAGFTEIQQVERLGVFDDDCSEMLVNNMYISLNFEARK
jgi:predicted SAM-dependent methyltransferase